MGIYDFSLETIDNEKISMEEYRGKVLLIVNTASKCGFTPQYEDLERLYERYNKDGFEILAFPCNQFQNQEPGDNEDIESFCKLNYGVKFPLFSKIDVRGKNIHPLYSFLINEAPFEGFNLGNPSGKILYHMLEENHPDWLLDNSIKWNFTKFLIDQKGNVIKRYESPVDPMDIEGDIEKLIFK
ncbi:glutathione peroxidase [Dethiothermospora halolimnae]|uniref:glutathione peroxidase n=1 Tax=Dethiothermospora halolimnae TaxID=3114390 RepID=UPI003CCC345C